MNRHRPPRRKSHLTTERPPFERIALILQGGGALGSYQAGVYQALAEANLHPDWVAGISIGAINSALIAGNSPRKRVERLREFWEAVSTPPFGITDLTWFEVRDELTPSLVNQARSLGILLGGAPNFFRPRVPPPFLQPNGTLEAVSYYDVAPLKATLERLVDFDLVNACATRFSVGAVNVRTGNFVYFDSTTHQICPEHVIASASLPPGFPPTEIEGEYYWDGGLVSNTPLQWVLDSRPGKDTLAFQVDLWSARGEFPRNLLEAETRQKEIRYSSRTRMATDQFKKKQILRRAAARLLAKVPKDLLQTAEAEMLALEADKKSL
jgi:NTE family protein